VYKRTWRRFWRLELNFLAL